MDAVARGAAIFGSTIRPIHSAREISSSATVNRLKINTPFPRSEMDVRRFAYEYKLNVKCLSGGSAVIIAVLCENEAFELCEKRETPFEPNRDIRLVVDYNQQMKVLKSKTGSSTRNYQKMYIQLNHIKNEVGKIVLNDLRNFFKLRT